MKRLFYLLFGLVLLPALLYAQGSLSLKDINDNLTNNYFTKTASDARYATTTYGYSSAEVDILLAPKADKTYVDGTDEAQAAAIALKANITSVYTTAEVDALLTAKLDVATITNYYLKTETYNTGEIALLLAAKANVADVYDTAAINLLLADKADTSSVTAVSDLLAAHTSEVSGAHHGSAIAVDSSGFVGILSLADNTAQKAFAKLDALSGLPATNAITKIYGDSDVDGCETGAVWLVGTNGVQIYRSGNTFEANIENATKFGGYYTKAETNATIEAAIAAIPAPSVNQTVTVTAGEALTAGQVVSLINESGTMKAYNNPPSTINTSPNGAESVFNSASTTFCSAVALDSTRFLVSYVDSDTYPKAIVGTVTGSAIAWGSESTAFENVAATYLSACKIATDKVIVAYANGTTNTRMVVLTVSTATITVGSPATLDDLCCSYTSITLLESEKALICYHDAETGSGAKAKIVTISGTTPTPYPAASTAGTQFTAGVTYYISVDTLSSTTAIVAYRDQDTSNHGRSQILTISGTTITPGTEYTFSAAATNHIHVAALTSTVSVIVYEIIGTGGNAVVATNSSGTITYGTAATFTDGQYSSIAKIDSSRVIIASQIAATDYGQSIIGTISETDITLGTAYTYNAAASAYNSVCHLGLNKSVIAFVDGGNSSYGTAAVNTWTTSSYASVSGISQGAYSSGSDAVVLISGVSDDQSGLITGSPYFLQSDFTIGTTPVSLAKYYNSSTATGEIKIGTAKSATELILGIDYK